MVPDFVMCFSVSYKKKINFRRKVWITSEDIKKKEIGIGDLSRKEKRDDLHQSFSTEMIFSYSYV